MRNGLFLNFISLLLGLAVATFCRPAASADLAGRLANAPDGRRLVREMSEESSKNAGNPENDETNDSSVRSDDPLRRDQAGVQTLYPAVCKIVGRGVPEKKEDGAEATPLYYGSGTFVAEIGELGLVLTNWHVVSESSESIDVVFPNFSSPAKVILRDEIWDLAALLIRKPTDVAPIPIALEVPKPGETLWVAGYGQNAGLADFQIGAGPLLNYVELVEPKNLPFETLAIGKGVRQGDSGGPIFNRYGEIAGVLWGSDGKVTMGTFCVRVQFFLTQAIRRLIRLNVDAAANAVLIKGAEFSPFDAESLDGADDWARWESEPFGVAAKYSEMSALEGVKLYGAFPISQSEIYVSSDEENDAETLSVAARNDALETVERAATTAQESTLNLLPPSPPIFSPTFVVQQRNLNRARPEVADATFYENLIATKSEKARRQAAENAILASRSLGVREAALASSREIAGRGGDFDENGTANALDLTLNDAKKSDFDDFSANDDEKNVNAASRGFDGEEGTKGLLVKGLEPTQDGVESNENDRAWADASKNVSPSDETTKKSGSDDALNFDAFSDLKAYLFICAMFCLFYNAGRLLTPKNLTSRERESNDN